MTRPLLAVTTALFTFSLLGACTWVEMEPQGKAIRVALTSEDLSYCQARGQIDVSVRDRVGFYERDALKVRDELEVLARNGVADLDADTLQAVNEPRDGAQRFAAYACGRRTAAVQAPAEPSPETPPAEGTAETFPIRTP